jgi:hypothetical protein
VIQEWRATKTFGGGGSCRVGWCTSGVEVRLRWQHLARGRRSSPWPSSGRFGKEWRGFDGLDMAVEGEDDDEELQWTTEQGETTTRTVRRARGATKPRRSKKRDADRSTCFSGTRWGSEPRSTLFTADVTIQNIAPHGTRQILSSRGLNFRFPILWNFIIHYYCFIKKIMNNPFEILSQHPGKIISAQERLLFSPP